MTRARGIYRTKDEEMTAPCPECGEWLQEARMSDSGFSKNVYLCPKAIGEQVWDNVFKIHYMPGGSIHSKVKYYAADEVTLVERATLLEERAQARKQAYS